MKKFLIILSLILSLQSLARANDVKDFEIGGISIGDSILDFFSEQEILSVINNGKCFDQKGVYYECYFAPNNLENYDTLKVTWKQNDKNYKIYGVAGIVFFPNKFNECIDTQKKIIEEIEYLFSNLEKYDAGKSPSIYDQTGDSYFIETNFEFKNGDMVRVYCSNWSKKITEDKGWDDSLQIIINNSEFLEFLKKNYL